MAYQQRLLKDIHETQAKPYPNIHFVWHDSPNGSIRRACLVLTPENSQRIHLRVEIPATFPLVAPKITCDSKVSHPNVYGTYICASILNTTEGWTPAYTLKAVAIQILSFFSSENLEQTYGGTVSIQNYGPKLYGGLGPLLGSDLFSCQKCGFHCGREGDPNLYPASVAWASPSFLESDEDWLRGSSSGNSLLSVTTPDMTQNTTIPPLPTPAISLKNMASMPDEMLREFCEHLEDEDLVNFAKAWDKIGGATGIVAKFNVLRNRELHCFTLKKSFGEAKLGIGISVHLKGRKGILASEFELLSLEAFKDLRIRHSVHGIPFTHWMPLPLSARHYAIVKPEVMSRLDTINVAARLEARSRADIIYHFMNDVIVQLSEVEDRPGPQKSSLKHASEKAIESFYQLFHLLLCLAVEDASIVNYANNKLRDFQAGKTSKQDSPNLCHLLLNILLADSELHEQTMHVIIKEAITRNVVWMFDRVRGAGMVDLAHMEEDEVCDYRLAKTFEASRTSYRLLMFFNLFRNTIQRGTGAQRKSLEQMCNELFAAHGAPPLGAAAQLAAQVKAVQGINDFFAFWEVMGTGEVPSRAAMTALLRECVWDSAHMGYHVWGVSVADARAIRRDGVDVRRRRVTSFFPNARRR
ncbi:hypothetical protein H2200_010859 [Cladophialophora chaetospira]|uniref:UBC core domain-containing protein n=1 Tax=Cladophialophora chaetospira TaxID=386627 RepID=A0AA39CDV8_9EURO|nr:hypothetical protein H2200_010859 [Cladophialophora chaetospira]